MKNKLIRLFSSMIYPFFRLYWFIVRPNTRGAKCGILNDGKILLIKHTYGHNLWTLSGDGIKEEESFCWGIKREIKEELGIEVADLREVDRFKSNINYKNDTCAVFIANIADINKIKPNSLEIAEIKWFPPNAVPANLSPVVGYILKQINING